MLLVDDDADIREATRELLEESGYDVVEASDGEAALGHVRAGARPAVILLDLMMHGMDGYGFLQAYRGSRAWGDAAVIVFTAQRTPAARAIEAGADAFLDKPFEVETLLGLLERFVREPRASRPR